MFSGKRYCCDGAALATPQVQMVTAATWALGESGCSLQLPGLPPPPAPLAARDCESCASHPRRSAEAPRRHWTAVARGSGRRKPVEGRRKSPSHAVHPAQVFQPSADPEQRIYGEGCVNSSSSSSSSSSSASWH